MEMRSGRQISTSQLAAGRTITMDDLSHFQSRRFRKEGGAAFVRNAPTAHRGYPGMIARIWTDG